MENHIISIISAALGGVLAVLLPPLFKHLTSSKQSENELLIKKAEFDNACKDKIKELELELGQLRMGVDMLVTMIEQEFEENSNYINVILRIKELIDVPK